jgi:hypothetical protein
MPRKKLLGYFQKRLILKLPLFLTLFPLALISCSQADPVISYGSLQLVNYENGGNPVERFSFFILPRDDDGFEDLEEIWLYHDWDGLAWHLNSGEWIEETVDEKTWIGSRSISMADNGPLPRGQYRAVLVDKGGSKTEKILAFDASGRDFPVFSIENNRYRIVSPYPEQKLLAYDNEGNYISTVIPGALEGSLSGLALPPEAQSLALWSIDTERSVSAFTDLVPLNE